MASSTKSIALIGRNGSASSRARRAGRSRTNSRPNAPSPFLRTSKSRSAAPAPLRRSPSSNRSPSEASWCRTRRCTRTTSRDRRGRDLRGRDIRIKDTVIIQRAGDVIPQVVDVVLDNGPRTPSPIISRRNARARCTPTWCARRPRPARRALARAAPANSPVPSEDRASQAISSRAAPSTSRVSARSRSSSSSNKAGSRSRPISSNCRRRNKEIKLEEREGYGETSVRNLFAAIEQRREIALDRFIYALGIRHVGETTALALARGYGTGELP